MTDWRVLRFIYLDSRYTNRKIHCSYIQDDRKDYEEVPRTLLETSHIRIKTCPYIPCFQSFSSIETAFWIKNFAVP